MQGHKGSSLCSHGSLLIGGSSGSGPQGGLQLRKGLPLPYSPWLDRESRGQHCGKEAEPPPAFWVGCPLLGEKRGVPSFYGRRKGTQEVIYFRPARLGKKARQEHGHPDNFPSIFPPFFYFFIFLSCLSYFLQLTQGGEHISSTPSSSIFPTVTTL